jgi:hypothetical protein
MSDPEDVRQDASASIQIIAGDEDLKGRYANRMSVSHTGEEFVLDFFWVTPSSRGEAHGTLVSRVVTSPSHFKRIVAALEDNVDKYEQQFGEIEEPRGQFPVPDDIAAVQGRYANLMSVSHTGEEFVLDFFSVTPSSRSEARGALVSRVVTSPSHFKRIVAALEDNVDKYEQQFGEIEEPRGQFPVPDDIAAVH